MDAALLAPSVAVLADNEASFGSRWPSSFFRHEGMAITFSHGEYRTTDPREIQFLCGVAKDSRSRDVWVRSLPHPAPAAQPEHATTSRQSRTRQKREA